MSFWGFTDNKYTQIYIPKEKDMSLESDTFKKSQIAHKVAVTFSGIEECLELCF